LLISAEKASFIGSMNFLKVTAAAQLDIKAIKAALIIISIIPILAFYPFVLKYFVKGRLEGSVKE
jgi:putative aldouronate transport system permease protein